MTDWWIDGLIGSLVGWLIHVDLNSCCADITGDKQYTVYRFVGDKAAAPTSNFDIS